MKKATHKQYGAGIILKDHEGLCKKDEVIFRPDAIGSLGRVKSAHSQSAFNEPASEDIVNIQDLITQE